MKLLFWILLAAGQDPRDEVEAAFPVPLPVERNWELAEAYHVRIAKALLDGKFAEALRWSERAKARLPQHLCLNLYPVGDWLLSRPPDHYQVRNTKVFFCLHAGLYEDAERLLLQELNGPRKYWREMYENQDIPATSDVPRWIDVAWTRALRGRIDEALEALGKADRLEAIDIHRDAVKTTRERIEKLRNHTEDPFLIQESRVDFTAINAPPTFLVLRLVQRGLDQEKVPSERVRLMSAAVEICRGYTPEGRAWEERILQEPPSAGSARAKLLASRGEVAYHAKAFATAEESYGRLRKEHPDYAVGATLVHLGWSLQALNRPEEARSVYESLLERPADGRDPSDAMYRGEARVGRARCFQAEEQWARAIEAYDACLKEWTPEVMCATDWMGARQQIQTQMDLCRSKLPVPESPRSRVLRELLPYVLPAGAFGVVILLLILWRIRATSASA
jgi:tetratricopeptide (TPR) repeat protein